MSLREFPALVELQARLNDYSIEADVGEIADCLLGIAVSKGPAEMGKWFEQLALELHRSRKAKDISN